MKLQSADIPQLLDTEYEYFEQIAHTINYPADPLSVTILSLDGQTIAEPGQPLPLLPKGAVRLNIEGVEPEQVIGDIFKILVRERTKIYIADPDQNEAQYLAHYYSERYANAPDQAQRDYTLKQLTEPLDLLDPMQSGIYLSQIEANLKEQGATLPKKAIEPIRTERRKIIEDIRSARDWERFTTVLQELPRAEGREYIDQQLKALEANTHIYEYAGIVARPTQAELEETLRHQPEVLDTGYKLDNFKIELPAGALTFIAGATGHGKTSLLLNLCLRLQNSNPSKRFYFLSYEEPASALLIKAFNIYLGKPIALNNRQRLKALFRGETSGLEETALTAYETFKSLLYQGSLTVRNSDYRSDKLAGLIEYLGKQPDTGAVFIDYIQLINPKETARYNSRQEELKSVCIDLKNGAVNSGLPLVLGTQFNRSVKEPKDLELYNIGEAGDIERIANLVLGVYNWDKLPVELQPLYSQPGSQYEAGKLHARVLKNRDGATGSRGSLTWDGNTGLIDNEVKL